MATLLIVVCVLVLGYFYVMAFKRAPRGREDGSGFHRE